MSTATAIEVMYLMMTFDSGKSQVADVPQDLHNNGRLSTW